MYVVVVNASKPTLRDILDWSSMVNEEYIETAVEDNIILLENQEVIAYLFHKDNHIFKFEVKPEHRNQGWGTRLLNRYLELVDDGTTSKVTLNAVDELSAKFYSKHMFTPVYGSHTWDSQNNMLMELKL